MVCYQVHHFYFSASELNSEGFSHLRALIYLMIACRYCADRCVKSGFQSSGVQKFYCRSCNRFQQATYKSNACRLSIDKQITQLLIEGMALRGIARVLSISLRTVISRIKKIANSIQAPFVNVTDRIYEMDELWTFIGNKSREIWISYIIDRASREVIDFRVGTRTKEVLKAITDKVMSTNPQRICTEG